MNFDNIDGIPLSSPAIIHFPRWLQPSGVALVIKLSPKFAQGKERKERGPADRLIPLVVLLIKSSYLLAMSRFIYQIFFNLEFSSGFGKKKIVKENQHTGYARVVCRLMEKCVCTCLLVCLHMRVCVPAG